MKKIIIGIVFVLALSFVYAVTLADKTCEYQSKQVEVYETVETKEEVCIEKSEMIGGVNTSLGEDCHEVTKKTRELVKKKIDVCKSKTGKITKDNTLEYEKKNLNCNIVGDYIECDEACYMLNGKKECGNGNGDGICQDGETCISYPIGSKIGKPTVKRANHIETHKYKGLEVEE
jgi:hypothetical protein